MEKIILAEINAKGDWFNLKTNTNKEISVYVGKKKDGEASNPKLKEILAKSITGDTVEIKLTDKDGKTYGWDPQEERKGGGGGKSFAPKDKPFEAAQTAALAAAQAFALEKEKTNEKLVATAEALYTFIMSKASKPVPQQ